MGEAQWDTVNTTPSLANLVLQCCGPILYNFVQDPVNNWRKGTEL